MVKLQTRQPIGKIQEGSHDYVLRDRKFGGNLDSIHVLSLAICMILYVQFVGLLSSSCAAIAPCHFMHLSLRWEQISILVTSSDPLHTTKTITNCFGCLCYMNPISTSQFCVYFNAMFILSEKKIKLQRRFQRRVSCHI